MKNTMNLTNQELLEFKEIFNLQIKSSDPLKILLTLIELNLEGLVEVASKTSDYSKVNELRNYFGILAIALDFTNSNFKKENVGFQEAFTKAYNLIKAKDDIKSNFNKTRNGSVINFKKR
jgi:hypothetical protein